MNSLVGFGAVAAFIISAVRHFVRDLNFLEKHCSSFNISLRILNCCLL